MTFAVDWMLKANYLSIFVRQLKLFSRRGLRIPDPTTTKSPLYFFFFKPRLHCQIHYWHFNSCFLWWLSSLIINDIIIHERRTLKRREMGRQRNRALRPGTCQRTPTASGTVTVISLQYTQVGVDGEAWPEFESCQEHKKNWMTFSELKNVPLTRPTTMCIRMLLSAFLHRRG